MITFVLVVGFPVLLALAFGTLFMTAQALGRRKESLDDIGFFLYPVVLAIPFTAALVRSWRRQELAAIGLAPPHAGGLGVWPSIALSVAIGIPLGLLLFRNELWISGLIARLGAKSKALRVTLDGMTQDFAGQQGGRNPTPILLLSVLVVFAEELLWRGFLIHYLRTSFGWPTGTALVLAALAFGLNHYYFGLRNVLFKALSALVWGLLFVATGSLLASFTSHYTFEYFVWRRLRR